MEISEGAESEDWTPVTSEPVTETHLKVCLVSLSIAVHLSGLDQIQNLRMWFEFQSNPTSLNSSYIVHQESNNNLRQDTTVK